MAGLTAGSENSIHNQPQVYDTDTDSVGATYGMGDITLGD